MPWQDVTCHPSVRETVLRSIQRGMFVGTHVVHGPTGAGQDEVGLALAKTLMCPERDTDFCDECNTCERINAQTFSDVIHLYPEKGWEKPKEPKRAYTIDHMRLVLEFAQQQPFEAERKLFLMHRADAVGIEAANCLLKMLEEPPAHVMFLLLTDALHAMLPTILSRCRKIRLLPLEPEQMVEHLSGKVPREQAETLARASGGLPHAAEQLLDGDYLEQRDTTLEWLQRIRTEPHTLDDAIQWLSKDKAVFDMRMEILLGLLRDGLLLATGISDGPFRNPDRLDDMRALWKGDSAQQLVEDLEETLSYLEMQRFNPNQAIAVTHLMMQYSRCV